MQVSASALAVKDVLARTHVEIYNDGGQDSHDMKWENTNRQKRLYFIGVIILLVGLGSAVLIYLTAEDDSESVVGYEIVGGNVYPTAPENSKIYVHDLELFGGKAAVLADEFSRWFAGLWHGKSLAFTVAFISIVISLGFFFVAYHSPPDVSDVQDEKDREGPTDTV